MYVYGAPSLNMETDDQTHMIYHHQNHSLSNCASQRASVRLICKLSHKPGNGVTASNLFTVVAICHIVHSVQLRSDVIACLPSSPHPGTTDPKYPNYRPLVSLYPRSRPTGSVHSPPPSPPSFGCRGSNCRAMEHDSCGGGVDSRCGGPLSVPTAAAGAPPHQLG